jgi:hypothetical protein
VEGSAPISAPFHSEWMYQHLSWRGLSSRVEESQNGRDSTRSLSSYTLLDGCRVQDNLILVLYCKFLKAAFLTTTRPRTSSDC